MRKLKESNKRTSTYLAFALIPLSGLITDMYLPSMPQMAVHLQQPEHNIQLTLSLFLISYGIAQFITGSLLDAFGRQRLTLISLFLFIISCLVIVYTQSIYVIFAMRIVQGIVTGFIVVAKRAFFVDVYTGEKQKHYLSMMSIVWSSAPIIAPFVGGYLQFYFRWQTNFIWLAVYAAVMLVLELIFSGETINVYRPLKIKAIVADYKQMMADRPFVLGLLLCGLSYGTTMIFALTGSFIIEHKLNFSPLVAGYAALICGVAWLAGGVVSKAVLQKPFFQKLRLTNFIQIFVILLMLVSVSFVSNIYTLIGFAFFVHMGAGFIFNNYFAFCLGRFPSMAGVVSGVCGGANFLVTSAFSYGIVWILRPQSQSSLGYCYLIIALIMGLVINFGVKKYFTRVLSTEP